MTASFSPVPRPVHRPATAAPIAIFVIAMAAVVGLLLVGVTFLGLAIAFPVVGQVAANQHLAVSASDLAVADRLADFWWLFGAMAVASFAAALFVTVKSIEHLSPAPRD